MVNEYMKALDRFGPEIKKVLKAFDVRIGNIEVDVKKLMKKVKG